MAIGTRDNGGYLKSQVVKRSIVVGGHHTSVSLEDVFWNELRAIAHERNISLSKLVGSVDSKREHGNLSSAIRMFVFEQQATTPRTSGPPQRRPHLSE
jgi:predicted DNA-binding ribbon-helix-helix protein